MIRRLHFRNRFTHRLLFGMLLAGIMINVMCFSNKLHRHDLLEIVKGYAETMLEHGVDQWGEEKTGMLISMLDRSTLAPFSAQPPAPGGVRETDRISLYGANYNLDQNLYQTLYTLSDVTGEKAYAAAADKALGDFITRTQSPVTGLLAWGEHLCWDLATETWVTGHRKPYHEMKRPMLFWDRHFASNPAQAKAFARGLWEHQIQDQHTGNFSRHALYTSHGPGANNDFPKEGSYMIDIWSKAYQDTGEEIFLTALNTLCQRYLGKLNDKNLMEQDSRRAGRNWTAENLSLAIFAHRAADRIPPGELADNLRNLAMRIDSGFFTLSHDVPKRGFVYFADPANGQPRPYSTSPDGYTRTWGMAYGVYMTSQLGMLCFKRMLQLEEGPTKDGYRRCILDAAAVYQVEKPDTDTLDIWPVEYGAAIFVQLMAHRLTGAEMYLAGARALAEDALLLFFEENIPLPKASSKATHYESVTQGDTFIYALLALYLEEDGDQRTINLEEVVF